MQFSDNTDERGPRPASARAPTPPSSSTSRSSASCKRIGWIMLVCVLAVVLNIASLGTYLSSVTRMPLQMQQQQIAMATIEEEEGAYSFHEQDDANNATTATTTRTRTTTRGIPIGTEGEETETAIATVSSNTTDTTTTAAAAATNYSSSVQPLNRSSSSLSSLSSSSTSSASLNIKYSSTPKMKVEGLQEKEEDVDEDTDEDEDAAATAIQYYDDVYKVTKRDFDTHQPKPLAQNLQMEPVLFVHVGKAGGSTIRHMNNKAYKSCKEKKKLPSNTDTPYSCTLARMTPGKFVHIWNRQDTYSNYSRFLVTVRNPIDRLVSWFYFSRTHKRTHTIHSCYNTINDLVTATMLPKTNLTGNEDYPPYFHNTTNNCVEVGQKCLMGEQNCKHHNFYNNEVYMEDLVYWRSCYNKLNQQPQIADHNDNGQDHCEARDIRIDVIRQEYAEFDFFHVLKLWGAPPSPETGFNYKAKNTLADATARSRINQTLLQVSPSKYISLEGVQALCEAICSELLAYKSLVANADNLNSSDVVNAFQDLDDSCHVPVDEICGTEFHYRNYKQLKKIRKSHRRHRVAA